MLRFLLFITFFITLSYSEASFSKSISYLAVEKQNNTIEDILLKDKQHLFKPFSNKHSKFGFTHKVFWLKIKIKNYRTNKKDIVIELHHPSLDYINIYQYKSGTLILKKELGDLRPYRKSLIMPNPSYLFTLEPLEERIVFIKIKTDGTMNLGISIQKLNDYIHTSTTEVKWLTFYIGAVFIMFMYNFIIFMIIKNISFLYYVLFHLFYLLFTLTLSGITFELFWPNMPQLNLYVIPITIPLVGIFSILFFIHFLNIQHCSKRLHRFLLFLILLCILVLFFIPISNYHITIIIDSLLSFIISLTLFIAGIYLYIYKKNINALFYFIAWSFLAIGIIISHLSNIGIIPSYFLTTFASQIGSFFEVLLLSIGLAYYYNHLKKDHEKLTDINHRLEHLSNTDALTQCYNRRYFYTHVNHLLSLTTHNDFFLVMLDLDYFKKINDTYGHEIGDKVLQIVTETSHKYLNEEDIFARYGGEEFVLFIPQSNREKITKLATSLTKAIKDININSIPDLQLSVSMGIAQSNKHLETLLSNADKALYHAKNTGRDKFCFYNDI